MWEFCEHHFRTSNAAVGVDAVHHHQNAFACSMVDRCLAISDRFGNCCLVFFDRTSDVDVEPFSANHFSAVVTRVTGHDDDLAGMTLNVDDARPRRRRGGRPRLHPWDNRPIVLDGESWLPDSSPSSTTPDGCDRLTAVAGCTVPGTSPLDFARFSVRPSRQLVTDKVHRAAGGTRRNRQALGHRWRNWHWPVLRDPTVASTLVGASSVAQLKETSARSTTSNSRPRT